MAAGNDASSAAVHHSAMAAVAGCDQNADYAVICSFFEQFGDKSGLLFPPFQDLQDMIENTEEVGYPLVELHVKLLRKLKKSVSFDRWEKAAAKFAHSYSQQDGWEMERFGYKKMSTDVKLRLLKNLLEAQFDGNVKFKSEINKMDSNELRLQPIGRDRKGRRYWHQLDDECNLRVFREDQDEETWELVSNDKESMMRLIEQLASSKETSSSEEDDCSPQTSNENSNANSQDATVDDGPSEPKRTKATDVEPVISEAIESPVLIVKGDGNGADCLTGNPGGSTQDEDDQRTKTDLSENCSNLEQTENPVRDKWKVDSVASGNPLDIDGSTSTDEPSQQHVKLNDSEVETTEKNQVSEVAKTCEEPVGATTDKLLESASSDVSPSGSVPETHTKLPVTQTESESKPQQESSSSDTYPQVHGCEGEESGSRPSSPHDSAGISESAVPDGGAEAHSVPAPSSEFENRPESPKTVEPATVQDADKTELESDAARGKSSSPSPVLEPVDESKEIDREAQAGLEPSPEESVVPRLEPDGELAGTSIAEEAPSHSVPETNGTEPTRVEEPMEFQESDTARDSTGAMSNEPMEQESNRVLEPTESSGPIGSTNCQADAQIAPEKESSMMETDVLEHAEQSMEVVPCAKEDLPDLEVRQGCDSEHASSASEAAVPNVSEVGVVPGTSSECEPMVSEESRETTSVPDLPEPTSEKVPLPGSEDVPDSAVQVSLDVPDAGSTNSKSAPIKTDLVSDVPEPELSEAPAAIAVSISVPETATEAADGPEVMSVDPESAEAVPGDSASSASPLEPIESPLHVPGSKSDAGTAPKVDDELPSSSPVPEPSSKSSHSNIESGWETLNSRQSVPEPDDSLTTDPAADDTNKSASPGVLEPQKPSSGSHPDTDSSETKIAVPEVTENDPSDASATPTISEPDRKEVPEAPEPVLELSRSESDTTVPEGHKSLLGAPTPSENVPEPDCITRDEPVPMANSPVPRSELDVPAESAPSHQEFQNEPSNVPELSETQASLQETFQPLSPVPKVHESTETKVPGVPASPGLLETGTESMGASETSSGDVPVADGAVRVSPVVEIPPRLTDVPGALESSSSQPETIRETEAGDLSPEVPEGNLKSKELEPSQDVPGSIEPPVVPELREKSPSPPSGIETTAESSKESADVPDFPLESGPPQSNASLPTVPDVGVTDVVAIPELPVKEKPFQSGSPEIQLEPMEPSDAIKVESNSRTEESVEPEPMELEEAPIINDSKIVPAESSKTAPEPTEKLPDSLELDVDQKDSIPVDVPQKLEHREVPDVPGDDPAPSGELLETKIVPKSEDSTDAESGSAQTATDPSNSNLESVCNGDLGAKTQVITPVPVKSEVPEAKAPEILPEETNKDAKSSILRLTFDYDGSAEMPAIPKAFLPEGLSQTTPSKRRGRKGGSKAAEGQEGKAQPVVQLRQSSRIAKLREKEDEERRKAEAERLQKLKEEHERREKRRLEREERMKKLTEKQQKRQEKKQIVYKSDDGDDASEDDDDDDSGSSDGGIRSGRKQRDSAKKKKKRRHKRGKKNRQTPWDSSESSEESSESDDDCLADLHVLEEDNEELVFKSDHEFSPESDLDGDGETVQPVKHARTARAGRTVQRTEKGKRVRAEEEEAEEEEVEEDEEDHNCQKCGQSDHPEWILLCDRCDCGWHASCVRPALMVIPEGDWFCPPCEHQMLLERLQERLEAYEFLLKEKEAETERRKEQERLAKEAAAQEAAEEEEEEDEEEEDDEANSGLDDPLEAIGDEDDSSEEEEEDDEEKETEDDDEDKSDDGDESTHRRRQRKAAQQANYSFKDYDDMIKSALEDEAGEEQQAVNADPANPDAQDKGTVDVPPPPVKPMGGKRMSTSDDDSDIVPRVTRKRKSRKLNDLSATSNEDDSDEDFEGVSTSVSDSEDEEEAASDSGDSFVVDDDSDSDVIDVRPRKRAPSPTVTRRSTRNSRRKSFKMLDTSDSEDEESEESEYEASNRGKRKRCNESWDESGESSSDASWGRSKKKRRASSSRTKAPPARPSPKKTPAKKPPARGRGRGAGSRAKGDSDDEPFRTTVSVKKIKESRAAAAKEEEDSDHLQRRSTRGRQVSYKELISSGESQDESNSAKPIMRGAVIRGGGTAGGSARGRGRGRTSSVELSRVSTADDESRFSGSAGESTLDFANAAAAAAAAAAAVYTSAGDDSHISNDVLPPSIDPDLVSLPTLLPQDQEPTVQPSPVVPPPKEDVVPTISSVLPPELQVTRLIQQHPQPPVLPPDLQINRLIGPPSSAMVTHSASPARNSPGMTPPPPTGANILSGPPPLEPATPELPSYGGVIKQTRHSLPPTPPLYAGPLASGPKSVGDPLTTSTSVIRPFPTSATTSVPPSSNPLSIQGLLSSPSVPPSGPPPRPYPPSSHLIGHGPFLNHPPVPYNPSPYTSASSGNTTTIQNVRPPGYIGAPITTAPRSAYPMYPSPHIPHGMPPLHPTYSSHPGGPMRPASSYQHAGFPQAFAAAAAAAANVEEERRIYRVAQGNRDAILAESGGFGPANPLLLSGKNGLDDVAGQQQPPQAPAGPEGSAPESVFGGLVSYFSSQQEDFEEA